MHAKELRMKELSSYSTNRFDRERGRLRVYREIFDDLIKELKTFGPILRSIKNEYENMLEILRRDLNCAENDKKR